MEVKNIITMKEQLMLDLKESMKEKNTLKTETIRSIITATTNFEKANPGAPLDLPTIFKRLVSARENSIEAFQNAGDEQRVKQEKDELEIITGYRDRFQPKMMSEAEIREAMSLKIVEIGARSSSDTGKVMGAFSKEYKGKADLGIASKVLKELLN